MNAHPPAIRRSGFLLLEVVLALGVFSIAATGFIVALHRMGQAADMTQRELRVTRILDTTLEEELSKPSLEEGKVTGIVAEDGIELDVLIEPLDKLENDEGQFLQQMFRVVVTAHWFRDGAWEERSLETWRYGRMYQP